MERTPRIGFLTNRIERTNTSRVIFYRFSAILFDDVVREAKRIELHDDIVLRNANNHKEYIV